MFLGTSVLAYLYGVHPHASETVISQFARIMFTGPMAWFYYVVQIATALILVLAANTSFADFPRLGSLLARDRFLPRQFATRGDKLVFSNGIVMLGNLRQRSCNCFWRRYQPAHSALCRWRFSFFHSFAIGDGPALAQGACAVTEEKGEERKRREEDIHYTQSTVDREPCLMQNWRRLSNADRRLSQTRSQIARTGKNQL